MADKFSKRPGIFDEDTSGFAFREVFTPLREGPLPRAKPRPSGKGGPSLGFIPLPPPGGTTSVWSAADAAANGMTLSNGGLTLDPSTMATGSWKSIRSTVGKTSGKLYIEFSESGVLAGTLFLIHGSGSSEMDPTRRLGSTIYSTGIWVGATNYVSAGFTSNYSSTLPQCVQNDVFALAVDFTTGGIWVAKNNVWSNSSNPSTGSLPIVSFVPATVGALFAAMGFNEDGASNLGVWTLQPTAASQKYAPPAGFVAWDAPVAPPTSVWSAADAAANGMTLSNGGLTAAATSGNHYTIRNTISKTSGKLYIEFLVVVGEPDDYGLWGVAASSFPVTTYLGAVPTSAGIYNAGNTFVTTGFTANYVVTPAAVANDVIALAVDFGAGSIWIARNNVWLNSSNPATATLPIVSFVPATVGALFAGVSFGNSTWTLQPTAASQKYAPPSGFTPWDSAAPTHSPQALAYLARTVGGNEGGNGANIATLIDGLVADGVWTKLDALYVLAQQNQTDARLNLIGTNYSLTGSATFTSYQGFSAFPTSGIDTGLNVISATSPHYTQNSASFGFWTYAVVVESVTQMGSGTISHIYNEYAGASMYARINDGTVGNVIVNITKGLFTADRPSATNVYSYQNGAASPGTPISSTSITPDNSNFTVGAVIGPASERSAPSAQTLSAAFIGASLGSAGQLALYTRLRTYMTAVGVP